MGLGMILALLSLLATLSMDAAAHLKSSTDFNSTSICMFEDTCMFGYHQLSHRNFKFNLLTIQLTLSALSRMLIYTGVFEFICSQSPHSEKGLIIGVFYAIRGLYQVLAALLVLLYSYGGTYKHLSSEFYFYLMNIVIGLVAVLVYVWVAKRYRYRVRDELCNVHQHAEEYYSNPNRERFYDYD